MHGDASPSLPPSSSLSSSSLPSTLPSPSPSSKLSMLSQTISHSASLLFLAFFYPSSSISLFVMKNFLRSLWKLQHCTMYNTKHEPHVSSTLRYPSPTLPSACSPIAIDETFIHKPYPLNHIYISQSLSLYRSYTLLLGSCHPHLSSSPLVFFFP